MCGIVGAVAERNVVPILMEGLRRLEYRGYDSAGLAVRNGSGISRVRRLGKVQQLQNALDEDPISGFAGISHTRWATHGVPSESNAHPHTSRDDIAIVHNGIIENYQELHADIEEKGYGRRATSSRPIPIPKSLHTGSTCTCRRRASFLQPSRRLSRNSREPMRSSL
jgi:glucosamine--fructose-6-phosphate aminotransferase (isomerizing)